jgi:hypothetical protein
MDPGLLNSRLYFPEFTVWGQKKIKTKRRDDEQNEENYEFIIRKRLNLSEYLTFQCDNITYIILTVEEYQKEKGYLLLRCEKARVHSYYDTCSVQRMVDAKKKNGASGQELTVIYSEVPCELVRLISGTANQSDHHNKTLYRYEVSLDNSWILMVGDQMIIKHKLDTYKAIVKSYFRTHIQQTVGIEMESEA